MKRNIETSLRAEKEFKKVFRDINMSKRKECVQYANLKWPEGVTDENLIFRVQKTKPIRVCLLELHR